MDEPEVELTAVELQRIREMIRSGSSGSSPGSRPCRLDRIGPAVAAEVRAAGLLEFDARCPGASAAVRARFVEELEKLIRKGENAARAVEAAMNATKGTAR
ncbi:MAG: hypothetical protein ABIF77_11150 [bacterium]